MLIELYIFFQILVVFTFFMAFFSHQEILWALCLVMAGVLMVSAYNIQYYVYEYDNTTQVYEPIQKSDSYPYIAAINMLFFVLALILGLFDLFDKYGGEFSKGTIPGMFSKLGFGQKGTGKVYNK